MGPRRVGVRLGMSWQKVYYVLGAIAAILVILAFFFKEQRVPIICGLILGITVIVALIVRKAWTWILVVAVVVGILLFVAERPSPDRTHNHQPEPTITATELQGEWNIVFGKGHFRGMMTITATDKAHFTFRGEQTRADSNTNSPPEKLMGIHGNARIEGKFALFDYERTVDGKMSGKGSGQFEIVSANILRGSLENPEHEQDRITAERAQ